MDTKGEISMKRPKLPLWGKAALVLAVTGGLLAGSVRGGWAHIIPGVDRPFDPPNYYSLTSISYPDSAPSPFTLRDMAAQGGNVYDYTRDIKSVLFGGNFLDILKLVAEQLGIYTDNRRQLPPSLIVYNSAVMGEKQQNTDAIYQMAIERNDLRTSPYFHNYEENEAQYEAPRNKAEQRREIDAAAASYAAAAQKALADRAQTNAAVNALVEAAANTEGETALKQIVTQLQALEAAEKAQTKALYAAWLNLGVTKQREELDEAIEHQKTMQDAKILIADPFDKASAALTGYERPKPQGFVPFK
jgi:hypothetical protein